MAQIENKKSERERERERIREFMDDCGC